MIRSAWGRATARREFGQHAQRRGRKREAGVQPLHMMKDTCIYNDNKAPYR